MATVEAVWYWIMLFDGIRLDRFLGAFHHVADQLVCQTPLAQRTHSVDMLRKSGDPASVVEQRRLAVAAKEELRVLGVPETGDKTVSPAVTAGTHPRLHGATLVLFSGLKNDPEDRCVDVEEILGEISFQALGNNKYRGAPLDDDGLREEWRGSGAAARAMDDLPDALWVQMKRRAWDPEDFGDRLAQARALVVKGQRGEDSLDGPEDASDRLGGHGSDAHVGTQRRVEVWV